MKQLIAYLILFSTLLFLSCHSPNKPTPLLIATAANMHFAMEELATAFTEGSGIPCELIVSSSGKLTAQISEGAPYDLLVAANMKYPQALAASGKTASSPSVYALGKLVLWSPEPSRIPGLDLLTDPNIKHIALANPLNAPYGKAAMEVLEHSKLLDRVKSKLVYGESIAQTNQFLLSRSAEIGFTALSVVLSPIMQETGNWMVLDSALYTPIKQGVVVVKKEKADVSRAMSFRDFLFSPPAQQILRKYGYSAPE